MSDKSRERFEAWAERQLPFSVDLRTIPGSGYVNSTIHVLWELWKARDAEVKELVEALRECQVELSEQGSYYDEDSCRRLSAKVKDILAKHEGGEGEVPQDANASE